MNVRLCPLTPLCKIMEKIKPLTSDSIRAYTIHSINYFDKITFFILSFSWAMHYATFLRKDFSWYIPYQIFLQCYDNICKSSVIYGKIPPAQSQIERKKSSFTCNESSFEWDFLTIWLMRYFASVLNKSQWTKLYKIFIFIINAKYPNTISSSQNESNSHLNDLNE